MLALIVAAVGFVGGWPLVATAAALVGFIATGLLCWRRAHGVSRRPKDVVEMIATSMLIPPLAVFWRFVAAMRFRTFFA